jgi:acetate CoA/acetoacetate CoA-transferase beta subunit
MTEKEQIQHRIARRVAKELHDGDNVILGIGIPTLAVQYLDTQAEILLVGDDGIFGMVPGEGTDPNVIDAGAHRVTISDHGFFTDSVNAFCLIRGGHMQVCVLGALQVDQHGNLANHIIPGKLTPGMGGAMELAVGAQKVIVATTHTAKGSPKILDRCTLPLTAQGEVNRIITELAVFDVTPKGLLLQEISRETTLDEVKALTGCTFAVSPNLGYMD